MPVTTSDKTRNVSDFFIGLSPTHVKALAACAHDVVFDPEQMLFREGDKADRFYLIRSGRVSLEAFNLASGPVIIQMVGAGEIIGWSWLVPPYRWHFDARACGRVDAIAVDAVAVRARCEEQPDFGYELLKRFAGVMEERLQATRSQLVEARTSH